MAEQQAKRDGRAWQCFCCGSPFANYGEYKAHILNTHVEGREFVKCPACEAPVRDLKTHFAVKHPKRVMPKDAQVKAVIWYDFKNGKRTTRKPKFKEGYFESQKNGGVLHYRSGYECEVYELLEQDVDVISYGVEPYKVPYLHRGTWHEYIPDLRVNYTNGKVEIWEIKPATQVQLEQNQDKWRATRQYTEGLGWEFKVITEQEIAGLRQRVRRQARSVAPPHGPLVADDAT